MTELLEATRATLNEQIRATGDLVERYRIVREVEQWYKADIRLHLQEVAEGLKAEGRTWGQVGDVMGGVSYQRAHQIANGE